MNFVPAPETSLSAKIRYWQLSWFLDWLRLDENAGPLFFEAAFTFLRAKYLVVCGMTMVLSMLAEWVRLRVRSFSSPEDAEVVVDEEIEDVDEEKPALSGQKSEKEYRFSGEKTWSRSVLFLDLWWILPFLLGSVILFRDVSDYRMSPLHVAGLLVSFIVLSFLVWLVNMPGRIFVDFWVLASRVKTQKSSQGYLRSWGV